MNQISYALNGAKAGVLKEDLDDADIVVKYHIFATAVSPSDVINLTIPTAK